MTKAEIREQREEQAFQDLQCIIYKRSGEYRQKASRRKELQGKEKYASGKADEWKKTRNLMTAINVVWLIWAWRDHTSAIGYIVCVLGLLIGFSVPHLRQKRFGLLAKKYQRELEAIQ